MRKHNCNIKSFFKFGNLAPPYGGAPGSAGVAGVVVTPLHPSAFGCILFIIINPRRGKAAAGSQSTHTTQSDDEATLNILTGRDIHAVIYILFIEESYTQISLQKLRARDCSRDLSSPHVCDHVCAQSPVIR